MPTRMYPMATHIRSIHPTHIRSRPTGSKPISSMGPMPRVLNHLMLRNYSRLSKPSKRRCRRRCKPR